MLPPLDRSKVFVGQLDHSGVSYPDRLGHPKSRRDRLPHAIRCLQYHPESAAIGARLGDSIGRRHFRSQRLGS
jgi:hypothetical protein